MVRIPTEYQEVEYLESTGTQYIDLPFGFLDTDEVEIVAAEHTRDADKYMVCASVWNNDNNRFAMVGGLYNKFRVGFGPAGTTARMSPDVDSDTLIHKWVYADRLFTIDDGLSMYDVSRVNFGTETANLKLFYGYSFTSKGKIVYYHHKKANGTEINLIPCYRKSDNEPGMYDTVSKTFFTNSGTGTFLVGNDVNYSNTNLLEVRRRILLNTPHVESMSGNPAIFTTDMAANLKECKIRFAPVQAGEGTPSPENVRPISGWDGVTVNANDTSISIPFPQTIFGGYVDLIKGEIVEEIDSDGEEITPNVYSLTPQSIKALRGLNNLYSDANGNIEVKFWKH